MNILNLNLSSVQISGNPEGSAIITGIRPGYEYIDGKRTENITHTKVDAVFTDNQFEKVTVKVMDLKLPITAEQLAQAGGQKKVKFKNLTGRFYRTNSGEYLLSASAESMEVLPQ